MIVLRGLLILLVMVVVVLVVVIGTRLVQPFTGRRSHKSRTLLFGGGTNRGRMQGGWLVGLSQPGGNGDRPTEECRSTSWAGVCKCLLVPYPRIFLWIDMYGSLGRVGTVSLRLSVFVDSPSLSLPLLFVD